MPTPISQEGYGKLMLELENLERVELPKVQTALAEARSEGDLKENAEYHAQRENLGMLQERIHRLRGRLADSQIVDKNTLPKDKIVFGRKVVLKNLDDDDDEEFELVGPGEEDYSGAVLKILSTSPLAQQLINHRVGDKLTVDTPGGKVKYQVLAIE